MSKHHHHTFSVTHAGHLNSGFRKLWQNPHRILSPFIKDGMTVLDMGCGPGFFTREAARLVGAKGRVIAVDFQQGMLDLLAKSLIGTEFSSRIVFHHCEENKIGVTEQVDLIFVLNVLHELSDADAFFKEAEQIIKPLGKLLILEPSFVVSKQEFKETLEKAQQCGFVVDGEKPRVFFRRSAVLRKMNL